MLRDETKVIHIGNKVIGGGNPILIQSMTNTKTENAEATVRQIKQLETAGCDIIRVAVPTLSLIHIFLYFFMDICYSISRFLRTERNEK